MQTFISDSDPGNDRLVIRLSTLLPVIARALPKACEVQWDVIDAYGYGLRVCEMEDALKRGERVSVSWEEIAELAGDLGVVFYNIVFRSDELGVSFGVDDSTYLLVEGGSQDLHAELLRVFRQVKQRR